LDVLEALTAGPLSERFFSDLAVLEVLPELFSEVFSEVFSELGVEGDCPLRA
jgi:hypothetical protein